VHGVALCSLLGFTEGGAKVSETPKVQQEGAWQSGRWLRVRRLTGKEVALKSLKQLTTADATRQNRATRAMKMDIQAMAI
jgi:hypothetical protein